MMSLTQRIAETPMAPYVGLMRGMSRSQKLTVVAFLVDAMQESEAGQTADADKRRLESALSKFHTDWGGTDDVMAVAEELRSLGPWSIRDKNLIA